MEQQYIVQMNNAPFSRFMAASHFAAASSFVGLAVTESTPRKWDLITESLDGYERKYWLIKGTK